MLCVFLTVVQENAAINNAVNIITRFIKSIFSCMAETACTTRGFFNPGRYLPVDLLYFLQYQLGNTITILDRLGLFRQVYQYYFYLSPVIFINRAWGVQAGYALLDGHSASWPNL